MVTKQQDLILTDKGGSQRTADELKASFTLTDPLDLPPTSLDQIILWMDSCNLLTTKEKWGAVQVAGRMSLRETLRALGATEEMLVNAAAEYSDCQSRCLNALAMMDAD